MDRGWQQPSSFSVTIVSCDLERAIPIGRMVHGFCNVRCHVVERGFDLSLMPGDFHLVFSLDHPNRPPASPGLLYRNLGQLSGILSSREIALYISTLVEDFQAFVTDLHKWPGSKPLNTYLISAYGLLWRWKNKDLLNEQYQSRDHSIASRESLPHRIALFYGKSKFIKELKKQLENQYSFSIEEIPKDQFQITEIEKFDPELIVYPIGKSSHKAHNTFRTHPKLRSLPILYIVDSKQEGNIPFGNFWTSKNKAIIARAEGISRIAELIKQKLN